MAQNLLAGSWVGSDRVETVISPWSNQPLDEVPLASADQVDQALSLAERSLEVTRGLPPWRRAEILSRASALITERADDLSVTLSAEAAKPIDYARGEVGRCAETFRFAAEELRCARGEAIPMDVTSRGSNKWGVTRRFPVGVVSAITPFNFPLNLVAHKVAPAIAAGCPVVLKPANKTPLTAFNLAAIVLEAGWPPEALSVLNMDITEAGLLVTDPRPRLLTFTGSAAVGWALKTRAGKKRVILELGGDAAVIVGSEVDDWDGMVRRIAFGAFAYAGQVCISVQRVLVPHDQLERLRDDLLAVLPEEVRVGAPDQTGVTMSALIDDHAVDKVRAFVDEAEARGAQRLSGGYREGRVFDPMVFTGVSPESRLGCEEVFGPVVSLQGYQSYQEALDEVNRSAYGLQTGLYTTRQEEITRAFNELEVGALMVNEVPTWRVDHMPYGGVKDSGFGREGLRYAYEEYTEERMLVLPAPW